MKHYEARAVEQNFFVGVTCDRCGTQPTYYIEVVISVNEGEEGGRRDEYDYCDDCLFAIADVLVAAGSRAPLVTGKDEPNGMGTDPWGQALVRDVNGNEAGR